jgi:purine-binding chemotaxis protein CheW
MDSADTPNAIVQRILAERAQMLAQELEQTDQRATEEVVIFCLGESRYAVAARWVREIYPLRSYTRLPSTPAFLIGLANVRSQLLSIIDIRPLLDESQTPPHPEALGLILSVEGYEIALLTDRVDAVRPGDQELLGLISQQTGRSVSWVRGLDQRMTIVLDAVGLVHDPRLVVDVDHAA